MFLSSFKCLSSLLSTLLPNTEGCSNKLPRHSSRFSSMILVACAGVLYYLLNPLLSLHGVKDEMQREQIRNDLHEPTHDRLLLFSQLVSHFTGLSVVSWWFSNSLSSQRYRSSKLRQKVREELAKSPPKARIAFSKPKWTKDVTPEQPAAITSKKKLQNRNAGKQRSDKKKKAADLLNLLQIKPDVSMFFSIHVHVSYNLDNFRYPWVF